MITDEMVAKAIDAAWPGAEIVYADEFDSAEEMMRAALQAALSVRGEVEPVAWQVRDASGAWIEEDADMVEVRLRHGFEVRPLYTTPPAQAVAVKADDLLRPIIGIENRTALEAFDIMSARIRSALVSTPPDLAERVRERQFYWPVDAYDCVYESARDAADDAPLDAVVECRTGMETGTVFIAWRCVTVDEAGDPDEMEVVEFESMAGAERCWPESLEAARAAMEPDNA